MRTLLLLILTFSIPSYAVEYSLNKNNPNYKNIKKELMQISKNHQQIKKQFNPKPDTMMISDQAQLSTLETKDIK